jgi:3-hydroxyisobutyrate dehydrogenase-like beta-hydroxyacid dehydrogenase
MKIGVIGLGRMGGNITRHLMKAGHHIEDPEATPKAPPVEPAAKHAAE